MSDDKKSRGRKKMSDAEKAAAAEARKREAAELSSFLDRCDKAGGLHSEVVKHIRNLTQDMANLESSYNEMDKTVKTSIKYLRANPPK